MPLENTFPHQWDEFKMQALSWKQVLPSDKPRGIISPSSHAVALDLPQIPTCLDAMAITHFESILISIQLHSSDVFYCLIFQKTELPDRSRLVVSVIWLLFPLFKKKYHEEVQRRGSLLLSVFQASRYGWREILSHGKQLCTVHLLPPDCKHVKWLVIANISSVKILSTINSSLKWLSSTLRSTLPLFHHLHLLIFGSLWIIHSSDTSIQSCLCHTDIICEEWWDEEAVNVSAKLNCYITRTWWRVTWASWASLLHVQTALLKQHPENIRGCGKVRWWEPLCCGS